MGGKPGRSKGTVSPHTVGTVTRSKRSSASKKDTTKDAPVRHVILVHGILGQRHLYWNLFRFRLERDGFEVHEAVLPYYLLGDLEEASRHLTRQVDSILEENKVASVDLVCHSAGGLVARRALRVLGSKVENLVMMGTANQGTHTAHLLGVVPFVRMAGQATPGSEFLEHIADDPVDPRQVHSLWSPVDGIVIPGSNGILPGADNIEIPWMGHWMFLWSDRAYQVVKRVLGGAKASKA